MSVVCSHVIHLWVVFMYFLHFAIILNFFLLIRPLVLLCFSLLLCICPQNKSPVTDIWLLIILFFISSAADRLLLFAIIHFSVLPSSLELSCYFLSITILTFHRDHCVVYFQGYASCAFCRSFRLSILLLFIIYL
jgi:hypothetical protein